MPTTPINTRVDKDLLTASKKIAKNMGIPFSALLNGMLKKITTERKIEFSDYTENGFLHEFENEVIKSAQDTDEVICETEEDLEKAILKS